LKTLQDRFHFVGGPAEIKPRYNIAPSQEAPVVVDEGGRALRLFRWGLIPAWAKDAAIGSKLINARCETVPDMPSFREPFKKRRCLVVADGFYEWAGGKPMRVVLRSHRSFAMAGIYDVWRDPGGREVRSFAIITTEAAGALRAIHDRMPVILDSGAEEPWLDAEADAKDLRRLLVPCNDELLDAYEVSNLVNAPGNDVAGCIEKV
jgi:putative SOS response-associated peptidase YedK